MSFWQDLATAGRHRGPRRHPRIPPPSRRPVFWLFLSIGLMALVLTVAFVLIPDYLRTDEPSPYLHVPAEVAEQNGWQEVWLETGPFTVLSYWNGVDAGSGRLTVYMEGDGNAWRTVTELSDDPSPLSPRVLQMAAQDPGPAVAWMARPCQYQSTRGRAGCSPKYWSVARYGEDVVASLDIALDTLKRDAGAGSLRLIGVSGGGTLAVLLAARRDDVDSIVTVAANLDHAAWTARLLVTPLLESLNAADVAIAVEHVPQVHFLGADDTIVTRADVDPYVARMGGTDHIRVIEVPGFGHVCCWTRDWPELLAEAEANLSR